MYHNTSPLALGMRMLRCIGGFVPYLNFVVFSMFTASHGSGEITIYLVTFGGFLNNNLLALSMYVCRCRKVLVVPSSM